MFREKYQRVEIADLVKESEKYLDRNVEVEGVITNLKSGGITQYLELYFQLRWEDYFIEVVDNFPNLSRADKIFQYFEREFPVIIRGTYREGNTVELDDIKLNESMKLPEGSLYLVEELSGGELSLTNEGGLTLAKEGNK